MLDINRRLLPYGRWAIAMILLAGLASVPAYGWLPLVAMLVAGAIYEAVQWRVGHMRHPEVALVLLLLCIQVILTAGIGLAHGPRLYLLTLLSFPLMFAAAVFPTRTVVVVTISSLLLLIGVGVGVELATVLRLPPLLICPAIVLVTLPWLVEAACDLDAKSRSSVAVDRLTGLLNRAALPPRLAELSHCAAISGQPVAVVVGDLDHFKAVNDRHGHAVGDTALQEVAYCLRKSLGPFQPIYRLGGEEFLILLPDTDALSARAVAETLREAVAASSQATLGLTISFGVSDSAADGHFDFDAAFKRADAALYQAKHEGRDRVALARQTAPAAPTPIAAAIPLGDTSGSPVGRADRGEPRLAAVPTPPLSGVEPDASERSWLIPDAASRAHLLDLTQRLTRRTAACYAVGFATVLVGAPYYGWWILLPGFVTGMIFNVIIANLERFRRPEYALGLGALLAQTGGAVGFLVAHGEILFDLPVLVLLLVGFSVLLPARGVAVGVLFTVAAMLAVALLHGADQVAANPSLLALPVALAVGVGLVGSGVGRSETEHRELAVIDPLTGMLNRAALETKVAAVTYEANLTGEPVALAVGDLDHFKAINDRHGHVVGDAVLGSVASRMRSALRAFDSAYRVGGEEFVALLPGIDAAAATAVAERIRLAVGETPIDGVAVTMSLGVAASVPGEQFDYHAVFAAADAALYRAKEDGRNRVHCDSAEREVKISRQSVAA